MSEIECQIESLKECQKNYQIECQIEYPKECQNECQKECQRERRIRMPDRMLDRIVININYVIYLPWWGSLEETYFFWEVCVVGFYQLLIPTTSSLKEA